MRCLPHDSNPDICQRCARSGRPCVFTPVQKRKQRKRTDTRVAELEREMRAMRSLLKKEQESASGTGSSDPDTVVTRPAFAWHEETTPDSQRTDGSWKTLQDAGRAVPRPSSQAAPNDESAPNGDAASMTLWPTRSNRAHPPLFHDTEDVVDRGILSMTTARQLFAAYQGLFHHYPMVAVPVNVTADDMRVMKPTLFLAIIAAAAGKEDSDLSATLDKEVLLAYATRSMIRSEKSLELVQALLVSAVWYHPPQKFGQLKYYEYIHMAATMAMDIGLGTRPTPHRNRFISIIAPAGDGVLRNAYKHPAEDASNPDLSMAPRMQNEALDTASVESRRTFLACFMICAGVSLSLRRPNMLRTSSYIRDCVDFLEKSSQTRASDGTLIAWVRLVMIAEEICACLAYDDPGSVASLADLRTQLMLRDFQKRLSAWWEQSADLTRNGALTIMYYTVRLYLHETALHVEHSPDDFRAPLQMGLLRQYNGPEIPTQTLADAIAECITCAHALCDTFLSMDVESLRGLPVFSYVRVSFATFILAKLCLSLAHPSSRIAQVLDRSSLKVESYMDRMILHVRNIVGPTRCRIPAIFLALLFKLRQWCLNPEMIAQAEPHVDAEKASSQGSQSNTTRSDGPPSSSMDSSPNLSAGPPIASELDEQPVVAGLTPAVDYTRYSNVADTVLGSQAVDPMSGSSSAHFAQTTQEQSLDDEFIEMWNDMNGLPEGGLTGLEDWSQLSTDMMGTTFMSDMNNWPNMGAMMGNRDS